MENQEEMIERIALYINEEHTIEEIAIELGILVGVVKKYAVALYIKENHTVAEAVERFQISSSSVKKTLAEFGKEDSLYYNKKLYDEVRLAQKLMQLEKVVEGGKKGKRTRNLSVDEATNIARLMINNRLTYEYTAELLGIPSSTLHDNIRSIPDDNIQVELDGVAHKNNRDILDEQLEEELTKIDHKNGHRSLR